MSSPQVLLAILPVMRQQKTRALIPVLTLMTVIAMMVVKTLISENKGDCRLVVNIETSSGYMQRIVAQGFNVTPDIQFISKMREMLGDDNVWINS